MDDIKIILYKNIITVLYPMNSRDESSNVHALKHKMNNKRGYELLLSLTEQIKLFRYLIFATNCS